MLMVWVRAIGGGRKEVIILQGKIGCHMLSGQMKKKKKVSKLVPMSMSCKLVI